MTEPTNNDQPTPGEDRWAKPAPADAASSAPYSLPGISSSGADDAAGGFDMGGFDMGGFDMGGFDMQGLMAQAQAMQAQLASAQAELAAMTFTGTAGGDLVSAVVSGNGELESVAIKPEAVDTDDLESLGDLIVAAVRDAQNQMAAVAASKLGPMAGGMGF